MKRVLVAGATGYLGRFVVRELKSRGYFVRVLARTPGKLDSLKDEIDEIRIGDITNPETLIGICNDIDVVFSSVGITKQQDKLTFKDVDYQGNKNLLDIAKQAGVSKFVYVSVLKGPRLRHLDIVKAHEDFVVELKTSGMDYAVLRPTGYFSEMDHIYKMAREGRVCLTGSGKNRINPIHGGDVAVSCVDAIEENLQEIDLGGPETLTWREIAELALVTQNKSVKIISVPIWIMSLVVFVMRLFSRHSAELLSFIITAETREFVGPTAGSLTLGDYYKKLGALN